MDVVVEDEVVVEIKSVSGLLPIHASQLFTYLKLSGRTVGLLINFNTSPLKRGIKRVVNHYEGPSPVPPLLRPSALKQEVH